MIADKGAGIGNRRYDHFASFRQAERSNRDKQGSGAGCNSVRVAAAHLRYKRIGVALLELALIAGIEPALAVMGNDVPNDRLFGSSQRHPSRHRLLANGFSTQNRQ